MMELFEKAMLMSIGAASMTAEHMKKFAAELEKAGKMSSDEAQKFVREMADKAEVHRKEMEERITKKINEGMEKFNFVPRTDFDALAYRVSQLEAELMRVEEEREGE